MVILANGNNRDWPLFPFPLEFMGNEFNTSLIELFVWLFILFVLNIDLE